ncbi:MAG: sulfatase-like hydrolase/transferase, partial [Planctomycetota bacterium]
MNHFSLLALIVLSLALTPLAVADDAPTRRPNIVFIIADDFSDDLAGFINGKVDTPALDRLAVEGAYFPRAYAASSVCSPSRYTCLTGQFASRSTTPQFLRERSPEGMTQVRWNMGIGDDQLTLPKLLSEDGYATGFVGKWHINGIGRPPYLPKGADIHDPEVIAHLQADQVHYTKELKKFGFTDVRNVYPGNPQQDHNLIAMGLSLHHPEWQSQGALGFIEDHNDEPFYLYYGLTMPHYPHPHESLQSDPLLTPVGPIDKPIQAGMPSREEVLKQVQDANLPKELWGGVWIDHQVQAVLDKLDELGIADNTLVVFFNDNGMEDESKGSNYEGGIVSQTMFFWPGTIKPGDRDPMIQNTDFVPTFLDLAGVTPPAEMHLDGYSLKPMLLSQDDSSVRDAVFSEIGLTRAVTTADGWKYLAFRVPPSLQRTHAERMADQHQVLANINENQPWTVGAPGFDLDPEARYFHLGSEPGGGFLERLTARSKPPYWPSYFDADQLFNLNDDPL